MKILFKYTTRSRPELFKRGMESIINNVASDNYEVLVTVDGDDDTMSQPFYYPKTIIKSGISKNKIDAINRDMNYIKDWDILVNMSDDMVFVEKGFDEVIRNEFKSTTDLCLHFPDGNRNDLITMAIMGREYYNRFNYIYHPEYISLYCDNEMTDVARMLGCYKYVDMDILRHLHPAYGKAVFDKQYQHTESFSNKDSMTYRFRKYNNFNL